ncbi:unnamed protein product, partial [Urochloa humidicola]
RESRPRRLPFLSIASAFHPLPPLPLPSPSFCTTTGKGPLRRRCLEATGRCGADLVAYYDPVCKCSFVHGVRVTVSRYDLARALFLPLVPTTLRLHGHGCQPCHLPPRGMARRPGGDGYSPTRFGREGDRTPTEMAPLFPGGEGKMASTKQTMAPASTAISTVSFFHSICFYTCTAGEAVAEQGAAATGLVRAAAGARAGTGQAPGSERRRHRIQQMRR